MGDRGETTTQHSAGSSGAAGTRVAALWLVVFGDGGLTMHALPERGELVLGRDEACQVSLPHAKISRRHARLVVAEAGVNVEDVGSTNGIYIGKRRLERGVSTPINAGACLQLGPYTAMLVGGATETVSIDGAFAAAISVRDPTLAGASELVARIAASGVSVLILSETGTGKEILTRTLHDLSGRSGPLVAINCASLGESLLESELFGHERGAFSGAVSAKPGLLEVSHGGTVLLDEIGDLSPDLQAKLLRALETRSVQRVGGVRPIELDLRVVAATHRNLVADVAAGRFRQDLYFRLNGITLTIPPLRERRDAIPGLVTSFVAGAAQAQRLAVPPAVTLAALARLVQHDWPGNVRELRQVIERALLLSGGHEIRSKHLVLDALPSPRPAAVTDAVQTPGRRLAGPRAAGTVDRDRLEALLRLHRGNVSKVSSELGTSRSHVRRLAQRFGLAPDDFRGE